MTEEEKLNFLREEMNELFLDKMYKPCLTLTDKFLRKLEEQKIIDMYQYNFVYMMKSRCYRRMDNLQDALKHNILALNYIKKANIKYDNKIYNLLITWWGLGQTYGDIGDLELSMYYYTKCEDYYKMNNNLNYLAQVLNAKAYYLQNENLINRAIEIEKHLNINEKEKNNTLSEMYDTKFHIYINKNKLQEAWNLIQEIDFNNNLKIDLLRKHQKLINKSNQLAL